MDQLSTSQTTSGAKSAVVIAAGLTLLFYFVPFLRPIGYPFLLLSTLVHEMGHGFGAILVGGTFHSFKMWANGSGVASTSGVAGNFSRAFVSAAGLVGPAVFAGIFFAFMGSVRKSKAVLAVFALVLALSIVLVVRNLFAVGFVFVVCALCFYFSLGKGKKYAQIVLAFFASQLSLSVFSRADYLFTKEAMTSAGAMPSDVQQIAEALFLPYWIWGGLCALFSIGVLVWGLKKVFG